MTLAPDWIAAPVLLPLFTAAAMLLLGEQRRGIKAVFNTLSTGAGLVIALLLLQGVNTQDAPAVYSVYLPGNWPVPYGIVLVVDRLSALMMVLTGCVALGALLFALARWHRAGVYFHVLFQLQLMGLYGVFLTADLFNLFVFFEVLLAASYALLLHGGGPERVRAGLHYIAINLVASLLFLIGVAVLYGVTGTLNMADIARKLALVADSDRGLLLAGASILGVAFFAKAALWPLNFWLPPAYAAAGAPSAAVFAILTKVGVYAVLRLWTLCFPESAGASAFYGGDLLAWGGIATLAYGSVGMLASQQPGRLAGYSVIASSGTLIAAIGLHETALAGGALYYLASSTLAGAAMFLVVELLERAREVETAPPQADPGDEVLPDFVDTAPPRTVNLDDDEEVLIGRAIPAALAFVGVAFGICAIGLSGLPPLSGFVGKLAMLSALLPRRDLAAWVLFALLIVSGLMAATALVRIGIRHFWTLGDRPAPRLRVIEGLPIAALLAVLAALVVGGEPVLVYTRATAEALLSPQGYIDAVTAAQPLPAPLVEVAR
ncbi:monovalent cation/H+ antiporter subunit D [Rubrivivax gelatinosus]|uniref:Monovalent cation/H+ antiporter subunit D n=1 Tax=Rubrivivax gelatinosus TaxID=28068 RepID=A0ABS1DR31_RUBGE|nr:monovalent cation/H+ antiporter subunit D [Rubrivivax gelatinosus]MBK1711859.1 monovalent cation/H+ antiporter subunit D [Rubrivivax gelatinosus]